MTEPAAAGDHYATILAAVISIVSTFFLSKAGGSEGRKVAAEDEAPSLTRRAVGASIIDAETGKAVMGYLQSIDKSLIKLVELTEGKEEKALREHIRDDFRSEMREMADGFRRMMDSSGRTLPTPER